VTDIREAATLPPPPMPVSPETEALLAELRTLTGKVVLAGNIATEAAERVEQATGRAEAAIDRVDLVTSRLDALVARHTIVAEQADSAIAMALKAHEKHTASQEKIDRTYDQLHVLCQHLGVPILGEAQPQTAIALVPDR
jgi:ABC-type transporter Mla subunit MlaD